MSISAVAGTPFEAIASDAPAGLVGALLIEVYDPTDGTTIIAPTTAGITEPRPGTYRALLTVTTAGTFSVRWAGPNNLTAEESLTVLAAPVPLVPGELRPTVADVAALLRARTKDTNGQELGTFTAATRPTLVEVEELIDMAFGDVTNQTGVAIAAASVPAARSLIALRAAMLVELSYFPEQVRSDRSAYEEYRRMYDGGLSALQASIASDQPGGRLADRYGSLTIRPAARSGARSPWPEPENPANWSNPFLAPVGAEPASGDAIDGPTVNTVGEWS